MTAQKNFRTSIGKLGIRGRSYRLGGLGKQIAASRLPAVGERRSVSFEYTPSLKDLGKGDNPLYVNVVQQDGQMAWSSPVYLVR